MARKTRITEGGAWALAIFLSLVLFGALYGVVKVVAGRDQRVGVDSHITQGGHDEGEPLLSGDGHGSSEGSAEEGVVHASDYEKKGEDPFTEPDQKGEPPPEEKTPEEDGHHKNDDHSSSGQSSADVGAYWAYEGEYGPTDWHKISPDFATCHAGKFQSPVALSPTRAEGGLEELDFGYQPTEVAFRHGGYTLEASLKEAGYLRFRGHRYNLVNVHFHNPSEHSVDGMKSDMEIHLFHKDQSGNQAMLAIMVMTGDRDFGPIDPIFRHLPEVKGETGPSHSLNPRALLPRSHLYYTYRGSQTTPPCSEGVQWFVLSEPIYFSARQLDQYLAIFPRNARPLQAAADREIRTGGSEIRQVSH